MYCLEAIIVAPTATCQLALCSLSWLAICWSLLLFVSGKKFLFGLCSLLYHILQIRNLEVSEINQGHRVYAAGHSIEYAASPPPPPPNTPKKVENVNVRARRVMDSFDTCRIAEALFKTCKFYLLVFLYWF